MKPLSKLIFIIGLVMILLGGVSIFLNHQGFALKIMTAVFWIFFLATIKYIWETKNER